MADLLDASVGLRGGRVSAVMPGICITEDSSAGAGYACIT
jgi:hypothetical protein